METGLPPLGTTPGRDARPFRDLQVRLSHVSFNTSENPSLLDDSGRWILGLAASIGIHFGKPKNAKILPIRTFFGVLLSFPNFGRGFDSHRPLRLGSNWMFLDLLHGNSSV